MSNHHGPEGVAPDDERCEALAKGTGSQTYWEWTRYDHRCPRPANQTRQGRAVCYVHAQVKDLTFWEAI